DLLILDEPTNHLDIDAIAWLEERLAAFKGGLVLVTHDRHVLDRVTTRVLEIDRGSGYTYDGGYDAYLEARTERRERAVAAEAVRRNLARRELAWLRRGAPARTRKPQARIDAAVALFEGRAQSEARPGELDLHLGTPRLGDKVVELRGVAFAYDGGPPLLAGLDLDTLRALEDFLDEWPGALVVVSHDRAILERTVVDVLALDGKGGAALVPGGYVAWEAARRAARQPGRAGAAGAIRPKPVAPP